MSTRETWAKLLPIIQAFVAGEPIQVRDYDGRWKDAKEMRSLLQSSYRVRPPRIVSGTWEQDYRYEVPGRINGPIAVGVMRWKATEQDSPEWPRERGYTFVGAARFVPDPEPKNG